MRLDFQSPKTYLILMSCFFLGFSSFFIVKAIPSSIALGREAEELEPSSLLAGELGQEASQSAASQSPQDSGMAKAEQSSAGDAAAQSPAEALANTVPTAEQNAQGAKPASVSGADLSQRSSQPVTQIAQANQIPASGFSPSQPPYEIAWADPSNYGDRFKKDVNGKPASNRPIIVLHETVGSADSTISYFKNYHANDADQASYHTMIRRNGTVVYLVPPEKRAFGAGNSVFVTQDGEKEAVKTHKQFPASVNNFAYHISLESPPDGYGNGSAHSGYTQSQYDSLAWLIGQSTVPLNRITTHRAVDRSGSRSDPRSFEVNRLVVALRAYR